MKLKKYLEHKYPNQLWLDLDLAQRESLCSIKELETINYGGYVNLSDLALFIEELNKTDK